MEAFEMTRAVDAVRGLVSAPIGWLTTGSDHRGRFPLVERTIAVHSTRGCENRETIATKAEGRNDQAGPVALNLAGE